MYQPPHFNEDSPATQHALIRAFPLGLLISNGPSGVIANPIPFLVDPEAGEQGVLRCHVARANPQWKELDGKSEVLVVFQGAQQLYPSRLVRDEARDGQGGADVELCDGAGAGRCACDG